MKMIIALLLTLVLLITGCAPIVRVSEKLERQAGGLKYSLIKLKPYNTEYTTQEWSASGGFFLLAGSFNAGSYEVSHKNYKIVVAIEIPKDSTIIVLALDPTRIRLKYGDDASLSLEIIRTTKVYEEDYESLKSLIEYNALDIIITFPKEQIDEYLAIMM